MQENTLELNAEKRSLWKSGHLWLRKSGEVEERPFMAA
jgi:hypothetical protein